MHTNTTEDFENINNDYHIKSYLDILFLLGLEIKLDLNKSENIFVKSAYLLDSFYFENDIAHEVSIYLDNKTFTITTEQVFIFNKPSICRFQKEILTMNEHLNTLQIEDMYQEYIDELDSRAIKFTNEFINEVNIHLEELLKVINTYKLSQGEDNA